ncbi:hypothetical protein HK103_002092 [Boothiomyces macroporosus]|uniref:Uncharacterized protein n=1 Tax=Boothiomyces macroporosus TaxID=261099 RepID=A0AAD5Y4V0_9FUNG|nr:hypothetical protein HK103_002092 [Boothiomyces macroporosus]
MSSQSFIQNLNTYSGLVSFAALILMLSMNHYRLGFHPKYFVRWMIYLDSIAFLITFIAEAYQFSLPNQQFAGCTGNTIGLMSNAIDSLKDGTKYGYLVFRGFQIWGTESPARISIMAFAGSFILYWLYILTSFSFRGDCSLPFLPQVTFNWSLVLLYVYWTIMDMVPSAILVIKFQDYVFLSPQDKKFHWILFREELRLFVSCVIMAGVTCNSIYNVISHSTFDPAPIAFVFTQYILVVNSLSVLDENCDLIKIPSDELTPLAPEQKESPQSQQHSSVYDQSAFNPEFNSYEGYRQPYNYGPYQYQDRSSGYLQPNYQPHSYAHLVISDQQAK